jgi:acetyl-CoA acyltransferase
MMGNKIAMNPAIFAHDENIAIAYGMGLTAEKVAERWQISREAQDAFAYESHRRALQAITNNEFKDEITPYQIQSHVPDLSRREVSVHIRMAEQDEGPRVDTSMEALAKLKTVFAQTGSVTAIGKFLGFAVAGVPPEIMGIGPKEAIPRVLRQVGLQLDDIGWIELNEAFAAQALAVIKEVALDPAKVNPLGGAIALGHPLGATGAIRTATLLHGLRRRKQKYGMVTMCIGTGMGAAGIFEAF